jgi:hypothetical protein
MTLDDLDQALATAKTDHKKADADHTSAVSQLKSALQQLGLAPKPPIRPGQVVATPSQFKTSDLGHLADAVINTKSVLTAKKATLDAAQSAFTNALKSSKV